MPTTCYYCGHDSENVRYVTFYETEYEHNEPLCDTCYEEWLASMKG